LISAVFLIKRVKLSLYLTKYSLLHDGVLWSGYIDPRFLDLDTSWRWVVSFTPWSLYHWVKSPRYPLDRRLYEPQNRYERHGEVNILDLEGTRTPAPPSYSQYFLFFVWTLWGGVHTGWVHSALRPLLAYCTCPRWVWGWRSWWNERFWQGKPKYSEKTCPDAILFITNHTCQIRTRTRAAAVGSHWLTASVMARPEKSHDQTRAWTRATAVGSQRLTASAKARPCSASS
jgi:hypothetical protein